MGKLIVGFKILCTYVFEHILEKLSITLILMIEKRPLTVSKLKQ